MQTELIGADRVKKRLKQYRQRMQDPTRFLEKCGTILSKSAATTFNQQGRPRWAARKDDKTHPILDLTGRLRDSVELKQETSDSVYRILINKTKSVLDFGTRVFYGWYHQVTGVGEERTRRPFLKFQEEDRREIIQAASDWFFHGKI